MDLVYIEWEDSYGATSGWESLTELTPKACTNRTVGWVSGEDEGWIMIVPHIIDKGNSRVVPQGCGAMAIPLASIKRRVLLKLPPNSSY